MKVHSHMRKYLVIYRDNKPFKKLFLFIYLYKVSILILGFLQTPHQNTAYLWPTPLTWHCHHRDFMYMHPSAPAQMSQFHAHPLRVLSLGYPLSIAVCTPTAGQLWERRLHGSWNQAWGPHLAEN